MKILLSLLSLSFFSFPSLSREADCSSMVLEYNMEASWSDMHNLARNRAEWFKNTVKVLKDPNVSLEEKITFAGKIHPSIPAQDTWEMPEIKGLSKARQLQSKQKKILTAVTGDLMYTQLYWDFLERTLEVYDSPANSSHEMRASVLPHLARELIEFDNYARYDLDEESKYSLEEYFVNRAIFDECQAIGEHLGITIDSIIDMISAKTQKPVKLDRETNIEGLKFEKEKFEKASKKESYFMEQILYFRRTNTLSNVIPNTNDSMIKAFQSYTLLHSGPVFIKPIPAKAQTVSSLTSSGSNEHSIEKEKKLQEKKKEKQSKKIRAPVKKIKPEKKEKLVTIAYVPPQEHVSTAPAKDLHQESIEKSASFSGVVSKSYEMKEKKSEFKDEMAVSTKAPIISFAPRMLNMRDVKLQIEYRNSTNYSFQGKIYQFPFTEKSPHYFNIDFLQRIKQMTHMSPQTDKLPNLAQGAITFHYEICNAHKRKTIKLEELFLSGGKFFGKEDMGFKRDNKIINAMQDMLPIKAQAYIYNLPMNQKGIPLGITMEKCLRRLVIQGAWKNNCVDSEAILILKLLQKLPNILQCEIVNGSREPVTLKHAVLSIISYRDPCPKCSELIQGFQAQLPYLIHQLNIPQLRIDNDFGSLAIVKGRIPLTGRYPRESVVVTKGAISLENRSHALVCIPSSHAN